MPEGESPSELEMARQELLVLPIPAGMDVEMNGETSIVMSGICKLEKQLASEKAARLKAEAACAEMRAVLEDWVHDNGIASIEWAKRIKHALSTDCGKGWLSPETKAKVREALEHAWAGVSDGHYSGKGVTKEYAQSVDADVKEALALLDGKEKR